MNNRETDQPKEPNSWLAVAASLAFLAMAGGAAIAVQAEATGIPSPTVIVRGLPEARTVIRDHGLVCRVYERGVQICASAGTRWGR